ncbi:MAG: tetratricopeptide repeat protein [Bacteroidota bacterium]|nr:hypothetical protein [Kiloniellaceae bacterium]
MTDKRALSTARRRAGLVAAGFLVLAGCAQDPLRPTGAESSQGAAWLAAAEDSRVAAGDYDSHYEDTRGEADPARQAEALNRYGAQAEAGDPGAAYALGKAYRYGNGVPANTERAAHWLMAAVSRPHDRWPHAAYQLGTLYIAGEGVPRDPDLAERLLLAAADGGYARAGLPLARLYAEGRGVAQDLPRAERLAQHSAESGDVESHLWLLRAYRPGGHFGEDTAESAALGASLAEILEQRGARGDARALRDLALIRYQGLGVTRDRADALRRLERAAELQHPEYLARFGEDIAKGRNGFAANPREGFRIMREAASRYWHPDAMSMVAEAYAEGLGTARDPVAAENWFRRAIDAGSARAAVAYGRILVAREGDPAARRQGLALFEQAAADVSPEAWAALGALHLDPAVPGADPATGIAYLQRAHLAGEPSATAALGEAYLEGRGVPRDPDRAAALLESAARAGRTDAMLALGEGYYRGDTLPHRPDRAAEWLRRAGEAGSDEARLLLGRGLLAGEIPGDPVEGLRIVASYAQSGDTAAMMELARAMRDGKTVPRDREAARRWFANAMQAGHAEARPELAAMLYQDAGRRLDLAQLEEAASLGHSGAMARLGRAYLLGEGASADPVRGGIWLGRAADAGSVSAAQLLGSATLRGAHGLSRDPVEARRLLEQAAAAGNTAAERDLGYALVRPDGSGLPGDPRRGLRLLSAAAQKGDGQAMELLGRVYLEGGKGVAPQPDQADVWLTRAAEKGFGAVPTTPQAASLDTGPEPDSPQDVASLQEAAAAGDEAARVRLGTLYLFGGERVDPEPEKGAELLRPAVRDGDPDAMLALGLAYLHGSFGERRIDEGADLLFEAARAGHPAARSVLTRTLLHARGADEAEGGEADGGEAGGGQAEDAEAEAWLDARLAGDPEQGLAEVTAMLREGLSDAPLSTPQARDGEAAAR